MKKTLKLERARRELRLVSVAKSSKKKKNQVQKIDRILNYMERCCNRERNNDTGEKKKGDLNFKYFMC